MSGNLDAINLLSDEWQGSFDRESLDPIGKAMGVKVPSREYFETGDQIVTMYESALAQDPDDLAVRMHFSEHLLRVARAWRALLDVDYLIRRDPSDNSDAWRAGQACRLAFRSHETFPNPHATLLVAELYSGAGFYATALHWYEQTEKTANHAGLHDVDLKARAAQLQLRTAHELADPVITWKMSFPSRRTPGLLLEHQPAEPPGGRAAGARGSAKGGCAVIAVLALGIALVTLLR